MEVTLEVLKRIEVSPLKGWLVPIEEKVLVNDEIVLGYIVKLTKQEKENEGDFLIVIKDCGTSTSFEVYEPKGPEIDVNDIFTGESSHYLSGYIKWDACSHFSFGDRVSDEGVGMGATDGYLHICGEPYFSNHISLIALLYAMSNYLIDSENSMVEEDTHPYTLKYVNKHIELMQDINKIRYPEKTDKENEEEHF